jgi:hypothetical protein
MERTDSMVGAGHPYEHMSNGRGATASTTPEGDFCEVHCVGRGSYYCPTPNCIYLLPDDEAERG